MKNIGYQFIIVILSLINIFLNVETLEKDIYNVNVSEGYTNVGVPTNPNTSGFPKNILPIQSEPVQNTMNVLPVLKEEVYLSAAFDYSLGDARLIGDAGVMKTDIALTINPIEGNELPPLNQGMVNVTGDNSGYRMLPKGMVFRDDINIILPYDSTLLPMGFTPNDIKTYFYHDTYKRWIEIERDSIDENNQLVISKVNHFTDFINAIIKSPEMPETASFTPTQMSDIKAANPLEGFNLIQPPTANNMGTVNLSYPIQIPNGRNGMQPSLSINYNSGGGYGWMGQGWDLNIPMISIETRWGVPRYNPQYETETYLLNGEHIATKYIDINDNNKLKYNKLTHRTAWKLRNTNVDTTRFYPQVEGGFQKIVRHGTSPRNYWWEVTDKTGIKYFYGKKATIDELDSSCVLMDPNGNIAKWGLSAIQDLNGNFVKYEYETAEFHKEPQYIYPKKIIYTCYKDSLGNISEGRYSINFILNSINDGETRTNCRSGLVEILNKNLKRIEIRLDTSFVRGYHFCYTNGSFGNLLLSHVVDIDSILFYNTPENGLCDYPHTTHYFNYYTSQTDIFGPEISINTNFPDDSKVLYAPFHRSEGGILGASESSSFNFGGATTGGLGFDVFTKMVSLGGNYNYTRGYSNGVISFIDITGDGLPDKVYKKYNSASEEDIFYRKMIKSPHSETYSFSDEIEIPLDNLPSNFDGELPFMRATSNTFGFGVEFQGKVAGAGVTLAYNRSITTNTTKSYFLDIDGDGLIDIARDGVAFYNRPINSNPRLKIFPSVTTYFGGGCDTNTFYQDTEICSSLMDVNDTVYTCVLTKSGIDSVMHITTSPEVFFPDHDVVRVWLAPFSGTISIKSKVELTPEFQHLRKDWKVEDGVRASIQHNNSLVDSVTLTPYDSVNLYETSINVVRGDKVYFRLESKDTRTMDRVIWNPRIIYSNYLNNPTDTSKTDADRKKIFIYDAKEDFQVNAKRKYKMPLSGTGKIMVKSKIIISEKLTDTVRFVIYKNNIVLDTITFPSNTIVTGDSFNLTNISVLQYDSLWFEIQSKTNVKWQAISWKPKLYYYETTMPGITLFDYSSSGVPNSPQVFWDVIPYCKQYNNTLYATTKFTPTQDTRLFNFRPIFQGYNGNTPILFSIKDSLGVILQKIIYSSGQPELVPPNIYLYANRSYYFDFYLDNSLSIESTMPITNSKCTLGLLNIGYVEINVGFHGLYKDTVQFGNLYRNWGQFVYRKDNVNSFVIDQSLLKPSSRATSGLDSIQNLTVCPDLSGNLGGEGLINFENQYDPLTENFLLMDPDIQNNRWVGYANMTYIYKDTVSNANIFETQDIEIDYPIPNTTFGPIVYTPRKVSRSISNHFSLSAGVSLPKKVEEYVEEFINFNLNFGVNKLWGHSYNTFDFVDMNGDGFPDIKTENKIQYSKPQGGLMNHIAGCVPANEWINDYSENSGISGNFGASFAKSSRETSYVGNTKQVSTIGGSTGVNDSYNTTTDETNTMWIDINGDGLPDNLTNNGSYFLNLGYYYVGYKELSVLNKGRDTSYNGSVSAGYDYSNEIESVFANNGVLDSQFNAFETSISGGLGFAKGNPSTISTLLDINGDGLVDFVSKVGNSVYVNFNLGSSFDSNYKILNGVKEISKSTSLSSNVYGSGSFGITIGLVKIVTNMQNGGSWGMNESAVQFIDMNADGYPDYVEKDGDNIKVRYNQIGKNNLLKSVDNFAGGSFLIDYTLTNNTFESPSRTYVMTSLKISDGYIEDGVNTLYSTFAYDSLYYHRINRESYGFNTVITKQHDISNGSTYRITTEKYYNSDYKRKGMKYYEVLTDTNGNKYVEKIYNIVSKEIDSGTIINNDAEFCYGEGYPALNEEIVNYYEGGSFILFSTKKSYEHGPFGNIIRYHNYGNSDPSMTDDDIIAEIKYQVDTYNKYIVSTPRRITVFDINSNVLRDRNCIMNKKTGHITQINIDNNGTFSTLDYVFDMYGNVISMTSPQNENGQRTNVTFSYDTYLNTYPVKIKNTSLGFSSNNSYNYKWGKPISTIDINGNEMKYKYDSWGRTTVIKSPKDSDSTIVFRYSLGNIYGRLYTVTDHLDNQNPGNPISTVLIIDGLGRVIQTKKDIEIQGSEMRTVSGRVIYDAFGREIKSYYPIVEPIYYSQTSINNTVDNIQPTLITYDILDRKTSVTQPDTTTMYFEYGVSENCISTTTTDPKGNKVISLTDARGLKNKVILLPDSITTLFKYNAIGELIESTDPDNHSTYYEYDMVGQRTRRIHPDAGQDIMEYDPAGNLTARYTQKLVNQTPILYGYNYNQLIRIDYPENTENHVFYYYGDSTATFNRKGRIWAIEDASGRQEFSYGRMGEVIQNDRTFALPNEPNTYTFSMKFEYDSWNRIQTIRYPDSEILDYGYDLGGNLKRIRTDYNGNQFAYIDNINYNKFGSRTSISYGNGTSSEYEYDILQRLSKLTSISINGTMQENDYTYDNNNNITNIDNIAPMLSNGLGGTYSNGYFYDNINRLSTSTGVWTNNGITLNYSLDMAYSKNGRITNKILTANVLKNGSVSNVAYANTYSYNSQQPNTLLSVNGSGQFNNFGWDSNGNMIAHVEQSQNGNIRTLCWDEENRLMSVADNKYTSYYVYDNGGERTYKLTGTAQQMNINGNTFYYSTLDNPTLYTSGYLVANRQGYTKHYYNGSERVASSIGMGGLNVISTPLTLETYHGNWNDKINFLKSQMGRVLTDCQHREIYCKSDLSNLYNLLQTVAGQIAVYYYHPDHLGSSSWITDGTGQAIQHLHYLPFGEDWVDQRTTSWNAPYTFSGKEKDVETGYGYFGARYYDSGLSIWLSVDPMSDKYPSMSPYNYCANNPVILVDPDGREVIFSGLQINEVLGRLQLATNLTLSVDKDGKVDATGDPLNDNDQKLLDAIKSQTVDVRIDTDGPTNEQGGSNGGTIDNLETGRIDAFSNVNLTLLSKYEGDNEAPAGSGFMHEITEAYALGLISIDKDRMNIDKPELIRTTQTTYTEGDIFPFIKYIHTPVNQTHYKLWENAHNNLTGHTTKDPGEMRNREKANYKARTL